MGELHQETERFWDKLLSWIEEGLVVPVVGQDLLAIPLPSGVVSLQEWLASRLAQRLGISSVEPCSGPPLCGFVSRYLQQGGDLDDVYPAIRASMPARGGLPLPPALVKMAQIEDFRLFVTTTFDSLLREALDQVRFEGRQVTGEYAFSPLSRGDLPGEWSLGGEPAVFHLLGRVSAIPGDYAVTEEDVLEFVRALQSEAAQPARLLGELNRRHLLILGGGFPDWVLRFLLRIGKGERLWMARRSAWIADAGLRDDPGLPRFLRDFRTRTSLFHDGGAAEFVEELYERWLARRPHDARQRAGSSAAVLSPIKTTLDAGETMPPGAVFLSYASEDRGAVQAIRDALERAGIDVWFDRRELQGGDEYETKIRTNIGQASLFLPIISSHSLTPKPRFFRLEWSHAERLAQMLSPSLTYIVPVAIDETPCDHPALPESVRSRHWLRLPDGVPSPEFVDEIRQRYREFQRAAAAS